MRSSPSIGCCDPADATGRRLWELTSVLRRRDIGRLVARTAGYNVASARLEAVRMRPKAHPEHRFSPCIANNCPGWRLKEVTGGPGSGERRPDFFIYERS
jgi:hypothetical protein